ncbi:MAG: RHS repeat-associated core domain-containing protein, partial [Gemmatimonadaceae bacterium]|nr:RHS repeat-associated core domain-containing protein [Gemmatimonadaceae bacterium]
MAIAYDLDGLITQVGDMSLARDAVSGGINRIFVNAAVTTYQYSPHGELDSAATIVGGSPIYALKTQRDSVGRVVWKREILLGAERVLTFSYDSSSRLAGVTTNGTPTSSYDYDIGGNVMRVTTSAGTVAATYDQRDRVQRFGDVTFAYSRNGERRLRVSPIDTTEYGFDALGDLASVRRSGGSLVTYDADAAGRRVRRKVNGVTTNRWLYNAGQSPIAEVDSAGTVITRFVYGERGEVPEFMVQGGRNFRFILDGLGSVRAVVDAMTGVAAQVIDYDAYGRITNNSNPGLQPFAYAGCLYDAITALCRFGAREYDAETQSWLSGDPALVDGGDVNAFAYAHGDPINRVDPSGLADDNLPALTAATDIQAGLLTLVTGHYAGINAKAYA